MPKSRRASERSGNSGPETGAIRSQLGNSTRFVVISKNDGPVTGFVAAGFEDAGEADHQAMELLIGDKALVAGFAFEENRNLVFSVCRDVAVQAIVADVGFRADEPAGDGGLPFEDLGPFFEPVELALGDLAPEGFRRMLGPAVEVEVALHALDVGFVDEVGRRRVDGGMTHEGNCSKRDGGRSVLCTLGFEH